MLQARPQAINPPLAALLATAQQVTPSGQPTVAAQVAQAAAQKEQAGIEALMPGVRQQAAEMAQAQQPVTQAQLQQAMAQQAQQTAPGIAGLPVDVNMAEGGIVGFANKGYVDPEFPTPYETSEEDVYVERRAERRAEESKRKRDEAERLRQLEFLEAVGAPQAAQYRQAEPTVTASTSTRLGKSGIPEQDIGEVMRSMAAPPRPSSPPAVSQAVQRPATAATLPIQQLLEERKKERESLEALLSPLMKKKEPSAEELAFVKAQQESAARAREQLQRQEDRYTELERQRAEAGKVSGLEDLANFLVRAGGARSLFAGLGQAARGQAEIEAGRRKEAQAAIDRRQQYMDLVDQRRDALEQRDLAIRQGQMERARAAQDQADAATRAMAQLQATIGVHSMGDIAKLLSTQTEVEGRKATHGMPTYSDLEAKRAMQDWMAKNPGSTISDAMDWWASRGKGLDIKESSVGLRALKEEQDQLIKRLETTFGPERDRINARLNQINQERVKFMGGSAAPTKTMTMADVQATAKSSGKSVEEVRKAAAAAGYTIQ